MQTATREEKIKSMIRILLVTLAVVVSLVYSPAYCELPAIEGGALPPAKAKGVLTTRRGTLLVIDEKTKTFTIQTPSHEVLGFRFDNDHTLIFSGLRSLGFDELQKGMPVEIDFRKLKEEKMPLATWIEVLSDQ
jgi:hypothetical protein